MSMHQTDGAHRAGPIETPGSITVKRSSTRPQHPDWQWQGDERRGLIG